MACSCNKNKDGKEQERHGEIPAGNSGRDTSPTDQCLSCTYKHFSEAYCQLTEYGYLTVNRRLIIGNLRAMVLHTFKDWKEIASLARECALLVQDVKDDEALRKMDELGGMVEKAYYDANPDAKRRLLEIQHRKANAVDVIIPLGNGSRNGNAELRYLLRSIDRNLDGCGRVFLATSDCPEWIDQDRVTVVDIPDLYNSNKDANLHYKTLETIRRYNVGRFLWCADDNAILQRVGAGTIPVLHNHRPNILFDDPNASRWKQRVRRTLAWARERGADLPHNYECHAPQIFDGQRLLEGMEGVDYASEPGLTIYTTWRTVTDSWRDSLSQPDYKWTFEIDVDESVRTMSDEELCSKMFCGYSDSGVRAGILERLGKLFPEKSKYEL